MLVLTKVTKNNKVVDNYSFNLSHERYRKSIKLGSYLSYISKSNDNYEVKFNVYDSNMNHMFKDLNLSELCKICHKNIENILGVIELKDKVLFLPVDLITWKLLSCINNVAQFGVVEINSMFYTKLHKGSYIMTDEYRVNGINITKLENNTKDCIYLCDFPYNIESLDENGIFWYIRDTFYFTLYSMYCIMYDLDIQNCKLIYIIGRNRKLVELEVNNEVVKIMTKAKVLGDKLCWS